jgi:ribosomal-protein-alanine N-acetyltransferase
MRQTRDHLCLTILAATPEHADEFARLHQGLFAETWDGASFHRLLGLPASTALLARAGRPPQSAGILLGCVAGDEAEILSLGVRRDLQRLGIATRLVTTMCAVARRAQARRIYLEVAAANSAALGLYQRLGFVEMNRRRAYYHHKGGNSEDALVLSLAL